jgi:hypothetical protein
MERVRRIELRSSDWRSDAQPIGDTRKTLERTEIIEISSLGWRPRAHPIYHARIEQYSVVKHQWEPVQSHFDLLTSRRKSVGQFTTKVPDKTQKGAAIFGGRPFLEIGMLFQDG